MRYFQTSALDFQDVFTQARAAEPLIGQATSPFDPEGEAAYYLAGDALSGFAVRPDGELVYVFSLTRGRGDSLVTSAKAEGASHLDCFDGYLPTLYARHGFVETSREANWTPGEPDVVFMSLRV